MLYCEYLLAGGDLGSLPGTVDGLLVNVASNASNEKQIKDTLELVRIFGVKLLCLDSSGFRLHTAEEDAKKDPERAKLIISDKYMPIRYKEKGTGKEVINLTNEYITHACKNLKPNLVMSLDYPVIKTLSDEEKELEFLKKLSINIYWANTMGELHDKYCKGSKLYLPLQVYNLRQFYIFIKHINISRFQGVSLPFRNIKLLELVELMIESYRKGFRNFHVLGTASFSVLAVSAYVGRHLFELITWDATSWRLYAEKMIYMNPYNLSHSYMNDKTYLGLNSFNPCSCPWCKTYKLDEIMAMDDKGRLDYLRCHNAYVSRKVAHELYDHAYSLEELKKLVIYNNLKGSAQAIEVIKVLQYADYLIQKLKEV